MESAIEKLVMKGDDAGTRMAVKQMTEFITKTLLPNRELAREKDRQLLAASLKELEECSVDKAIGNDMHLHERVSRAKEHAENFRRSMAEHGECLSIADGKALVRDARCSSADVGKCTQKDSNPVGNDKECCDAYAAHEAHIAKCQRSKDEADYAKKQESIITNDVCDQYSQCYSKNLADLRKAESRVKSSEERREWHTIHTIQCLVDTFDNGKVSNEGAKACKTKKHATQEIDFPEAPPKQQC